MTPRADLHKWPPPAPADGWALAPGASLIGKLPGVLEDENMRAGQDGTLAAREDRLTEEMALELNLTFAKPQKRDELMPRED